MKCYALGLCALSAVLVMTGCVNPDGSINRGGTGALAGGAIGATSGALIGGRHAGEGALIGGAFGALTGGLIGHSMDEQEREERERLRAEAPQTYVRVEQGQPLAVADVKAMVSSHVSDNVIISQIQSTRSVYHLSAADIIDLHNAGVSESVINYMINTPTTTTTTTASAAPAAQDSASVEQAPPPPQTEAVVVAPDPNYVWIPGAWQWNGRWVWASGYWAPPPYPRAVWINGYWSHGPYGWRRVPGRWR